MKNITNTKLFRRVTSVGVLSIALLGSVACAPNYSTGSRAGVVTKLSNKGLVWKSWEGELNMGGVKTVTNSDGNVSTVANVFTFNVSPEAVEKVQEALRTGKRVELVYRGWAIAPVTIDNSHVITDVKPAQ